MCANKAKCLYKVFVVLVSTFIVLSCQKSHDNNNNTNGNDSTAKREYITIKDGGSASQSLISIVKDGEGYDFNIYGTTNTNGEIQAISAISIVNENSADSVYNFIYDSLTKVRTAYLTVKGIKDTSLIGFDYKNDTTIVTSYDANWTDNTLKAKWQVFLKQDANNITAIGAQSLRLYSTRRGANHTNSLFHKGATGRFSQNSTTIYKMQGGVDVLKLALYGALTVIGAAGILATGPVVIAGVTISQTALIIGGFAVDFFAIKGATKIAPAAIDTIIKALMDVVAGKDAAAS